MPHVKVGDIKMYFEIQGLELKRSGEGFIKKPTILFIHGGPGIADHTLYLEFWSKLKDVAQIVFVDMRGCGRTEHGDPALWNLRQNGHDAFKFCEALGIEKPIVGGVSWGGYVALSYAIQHPTHPLGLILCNTEAHASKKLRREFFEKISGSAEIGDLVSRYDNAWTPELQVEFMEKCIRYYSKNAYRKEEFSGCIKNPALWEKFIRNEMYNFDMRADLPKIQCDVLYLAGTRDPVHPYPCAEETAAGIKKVNLNIIEDAADPVYRDKPEETLEIIAGFLKGMEHALTV